MFGLISQAIWYVYTLVISHLAGFEHNLCSNDRKELHKFLKSMENLADEYYKKDNIHDLANFRKAVTLCKIWIADLFEE